MAKLKLTKTNIIELQANNKIVDYFDSEVNGLVLRVFPSGAKTFTVLYRNADKKQKRYTIGKFPTIPLPVAKKEAQRLLLLVSQGHDIQNEKKQNSDSGKLTLKSYLDRFYIDWSRKNHKSYIQTHHRLLNTCQSLHGTLLDEIDLKTLNNFLFQYKTDANVSDSTLNKTATVLKGAVSRAVEFGYLQDNKLVGFKKFKESPGKIRYLSTRESASLLKALDGADELISNLVKVAYYTGMRRGEIFTLTWSDIDLKTNQITLDKDNTKSGHSRSIPMHKNIRQIFLDISSSGKQSGIIFKSPITGSKLDNINKSWTTLMRNAGIENFRFHDLRHNFASQLVMKGESLSVVRELLGHSDFKMTLRYAHLAPEHKQKAVDLL